MFQPIRNQTSWLSENRSEPLVRYIEVTDLTHLAEKGSKQEK